jgi:oxygen-independent coproporphyrinogen-3 oxidase
MNAGLYVHVPFCARLCSYCDFYKLVAGPAVQDRWVEALIREAEIRGHGWIRHSFDSVFFGGGTPSHLGPERLGRLLRGLRATLPIAGDAEWTLEMNPESAREDVLSAALEGGVNRLSFGIQSLNDGELSMLGRLHDAGSAREAVGRARRAGYGNISVDLIYGLPSRPGGDGAWERTLRGAIDLGPEHVSCYLLTLEPGVPMARAVARGELRPPPEEAAVAQYALARELLAAAGYERYEISNWARAGRRCRHNVNVWQGGIYLGLGPGAHGYDGAARRANRPDLGEYLAALEAGGEPPHALEPIGGRAREEEILFLGLRLREGLAWSELSNLLGPERAEALRRRSARWNAMGLLIDEGGRLRIGEDGLFVSNALVADLLESI